MIEFAGFIFFLVVSLASRSSLAYPEIMNSYLAVTVTFIVFCEFLVHILKNKKTTLRRRYLNLCALYTVFLLYEVLLILNTYSLEIRSVIYLKTIFSFIMLVVSLSMVFYVKYIDFKDTQNLGGTYRTFEIIITAMLAVIAVINSFISTSFISQSRYIVLIIDILLGLLALLSVVVEFSRKYWYHKQILEIRLLKLIDDHSIDKAVMPSIKSIEDDQILRELKYTLSYSFVRKFEMIRITSWLYHTMIKKGFTWDVSIRYAGQLSEVIVINLMKRKNDFSYWPNFMLILFDKLKKRSKNDNRKSLN